LKKDKIMKEDKTIKKDKIKRIIYARTFLALGGIYFILIIGFTIFQISQEKKAAGQELRTFAVSVNNAVENILKDNVDNNNRVTDIAKIKKEFIKETEFFTSSGSEVTVFTGNYELIFNTNHNYWLCSYTEYWEGSKQYIAYGYLNPGDWFSEKEVAELEKYLYTNQVSPKAKKEGDFLSYSLDLEGFWVDDGIIIPDKISVVALYVKTVINRDEKGNVKAATLNKENIATYVSNYKNTEGLPYFQDGNIYLRTNNNRNSKSRNELRQILTDKEILKEAIITLPDYSIKRMGPFNYHYYLPMPYQNSIRVLSEQNYYSEFWTVVGRNVNMWERCSTTLIFTWISCFIIFAVSALLLSEQTYKIYKEREELEKQRQEITNAFAHDLKTPLSIISGYAQNLLENIHTEKREHYASHILANVNRMAGIIQDMLEMSRLETKPFQIKYEDISLGELCSKIINRYEHICNDKAITASVEGDAVIKADNALITRVIDNFFINALDNTPQGGSIRMKILEDTFEIYNSGSHIPEDKLDEIWLPYKKADPSRSNTKGTGLGLAISRTILETHKFSYGAKNINNGVVFWFNFR